MNLKNITAPLADKIGDLAELVQEMVNNVKEQTGIQKEILVRLGDIDEKLNAKNQETVDKTLDTHS